MSLSSHKTLENFHHGKDRSCLNLCYFDFKGHLTSFWAFSSVWFLIRQNSFQSWYSREKSFSINLLGHVKIIIPILKNCLVFDERFRWHSLCLEYLIKRFWLFRTFSFYPYKPSFVKATTSLVAVNVTFGICRSIAFKWYIIGSINWIGKNPGNLRLKGLRGLNQTFLTCKLNLKLSFFLLNFMRFNSF